MKRQILAELSSEEAFGARSVAFGDLDGDDRLDVVAVIEDLSVSTEVLHKVVIHWAQADGSFSSPQPVFELGLRFSAVATAKVDSDHIDDLVILEGLQENPPSARPIVAFGSADRQLSVAMLPEAEVGNGGELVSGDFDGNGLTDVALSRSNHVWSATGERTFALSSLDYEGRKLLPSIVADFDGDGANDVAGFVLSSDESTSEPQLVFGAGDGHATGSDVLDDLMVRYWSTAADFNDDDKLDFAGLLHDATTGGARLTLDVEIANTSSYSRQTDELQPLLAAGGHACLIDSNDTNGDGHTDLVFAAIDERLRSSSGGRQHVLGGCEAPAQWRALRILLGDGTGSFAERDCAPTLAIGGLIVDYDIAERGAGRTSDIVIATERGVEVWYPNP